MKKSVKYNHLQRRTNPTLKKKQNAKEEQQLQQQQQQQQLKSIEPIEEPVLNPASQAKLALLAEKEKELEQVFKIKEKSDALVKCFQDLAEGVTDLSKGAQGVSETLANWNRVFNIMGEMKYDDNNRNPKWVRFESSIISDNSSIQQSHDLLPAPTPTAVPPAPVERKRKLRE